MANSYASASRSARQLRRQGHGRENRSRSCPPVYVQRAVGGFIGWLVAVSGRVGEVFDCRLSNCDGDNEPHENTFTARAEVQRDEVLLMFLDGDKVLSEITFERRRLNRFRSLAVPSRAYGAAVRFEGAGARQIAALLRLLKKKRKLQVVWSLIQEGAFALPQHPARARSADYVAA